MATVVIGSKPQEEPEPEPVEIVPVKAASVEPVEFEYGEPAVFPVPDDGCEIDEDDPRMQTNAEWEEERPHVEITGNNLRDKYWRMNNLYTIIDKDAKRVLFKMNYVQHSLWDNLWYMSLILKGRQQGFTTFIDLYMLDECLFNSDVEAGIIAHTKPDAMEIFRRKVRFPYDNLDDRIKNSIGLQGRSGGSKSQLHFTNNSLISVGTSMRSATLQYLHISELGKVAKKFPEKAREIMTGAMESVGQGDTMVFIESTGEGKSGIYFDMCNQAQKLEHSGEEPTRLEFKFNFSPWFVCPDNVLNDPVAITKEMAQYFTRVEANTGTKLSPEQKAWYIVKRRLLGDDIMREHPSTEDEAFESGVKGSYFKSQFVKIRQEGRICKVPHHAGIVVDTWWDLGMDDSTSIWFSQDIGREVHWLNYYENSGEGLDFYRGLLDEWGKKYGYKYGRIVAPHDINVRELGPGISRLESAKKLGMNMEVSPRVENKMDGIEQARRLLGISWFDEVNCDVGLEHLEEYRKEWDEINGVFRNTPLHNEHCHGADAFQTASVSHGFRPAGSSYAAGGRRRAKTIVTANPEGWT